MDLSTTYLGLELPHPLMVGASPMVDDLDLVRRLEDAGAAAIVMHSLFEEQITLEQVAEQQLITAHEDMFAEAMDYLPKPVDFALGPDEYLEQLRQVKQAVSIPVIGSLNGVTPHGWLEYATLIEQAGADALELNVYQLVSDPEESADDVEGRMVAMLKNVMERTKLPVAVKLSPFYTSLPHFAKRITDAGADGLVLFNRFYQPDIDVEELEVDHTLHLSTSGDLLLRLRWLAILSARIETSFALTGGVHSAIDALKGIMAGAHAVQVVSAILRHGPDQLSTMHKELEEWLKTHEYESLRQAQGSMNLSRSPDASAYERVNYMRMLQSFSAPVMTRQR